MVRVRVEIKFRFRVGGIAARCAPIYSTDTFGLTKKASLNKNS